jgi:hypothetical protein
VTNDDFHEGVPDFGKIDWSQMEDLANNGGDTEALAPETFQQIVLSEDMIVKRVVWDLAPHVEIEKIVEFLSLPPASDEIMDKEHAEAHARLEKVFIIGEPVDMLSRIAARAVLATMNVMNDSSDVMDIDSEEFNDAADKLESVIFNSTLSAIAELVDWGLLHTPHILTMEEYQRKMQSHLKGIADDEDEGTHE